jgi:hypothetical protein
MRMALTRWMWRVREIKIAMDSTPTPTQTTRIPYNDIISSLPTTIWNTGVGADRKAPKIKKQLLRRHSNSRRHLLFSSNSA